MEDKLSILLVTTDYPGDPKGTGMGTYTKIMATNLAELGHKVHVLSRAGKDRKTENIKNIEFHFIDIPRPDVPVNPSFLKIIHLAFKGLIGEYKYRKAIAKEMHDILDSENIDLIESTDAFAEILFFNQKKYAHIPLVIRLHTPLSVGELFDKNVPEFVRRIIRLPERKQLLKASHLSVPSKAGQKLFRKEMSLANKPIRHIPNPPPNNLEIKKIASKNQDIVYVGRITRTKGIPFLMKTIPLVLEEYPDATFTLIGGDAGNPEGFDEKTKWLKDMLPSKYRDNVIFTGFLGFEEFSSYVENAALAILPSLFDNFPYVCLELMSFGKAIVSSDQGGMVEMLDGGNCGRLFTPENSNDFANHIIELLGDSELREELGRKAQERLQRFYAKDKIMSETLDYYRQCIAEI